MALLSSSGTPTEAEVLTHPLPTPIVTQTAPHPDTLIPAKSIVVDLSEQTLSAYYYGSLEKQFAVSTGLTWYPTPTGTFAVRRKIPVKDYRWSYGANHPANYYLPNVAWNLEFKPHYYLHYAYWHNNFGRRMSHGCVNMPLAESEWIYHWAEVGTPVTIVD